MSELKRLMIVMGTRPEAIKMAPVIRELKSRPEFDVQVCVTAQHRQMLDQVLHLFKIKPDFDLDLMAPRQNLTDLTSRALVQLSAVFEKAKPSRVLVHGDTTTTLAGALAAFYQKIPVAHVEAGLRTNDLMSPWPEEGNRQLTSKLTDMHFAPTETSALNLKKENVPTDQIHVTGNSVIDALLIARQEIESRADLRSTLEAKFPFVTAKSTARKTILVTAHRRENFGDGIRNICAALKTLATEDDVRILFPVHLNPNIRETANSVLGGVANVQLLEPLDYLEFVYLLGVCDIAITDSGGVQEEAPSLGKPVLVLRETTERPEAVVAGTVKLIGTAVDSILQETRLLLRDSKEYLRMSQAHNPYGDGLTSRRIADILSKEPARGR